MLAMKKVRFLGFVIFGWAIAIFIINTTFWDKKPKDGVYNVIKNKSGDYSLEGYGNITESLPIDQAAISRLVSTSLRHGTDIKFIVEQLNKIKGDIFSSMF